MKKIYLNLHIQNGHTTMNYMNMKHSNYNQPGKRNSFSIFTIEYYRKFQVGFLNYLGMKCLILDLKEISIISLIYSQS